MKSRFGFVYLYLTEITSARESVESQSSSHHFSPPDYGETFNNTLADSRLIGHATCSGLGSERGNAYQLAITLIWLHGSDHWSRFAPLPFNGPTLNWLRRAERQNISREYPQSADRLTELRTMEAWQAASGHALSGD